MSFRDSGMRGPEMLFAMLFFKTTRSLLRNVLDLPEMKIAIESGRLSSRTIPCANSEFGSLADKAAIGPEMIQSRVVFCGRFTFGALSNIAQNKPNRSASIIRSIGSEFMGSLSASLSPAIYFQLYPVLTRFGKYFVNDRSINAVVK